MLINNIFIKLIFILIFILFSNFSSAEFFLHDEQGCPKRMHDWAKYSLNEKKHYEIEPKRELLCLSRSIHILNYFDDKNIKSFKIFLAYIKDNQLEDSNYFFLKAKTYQIGIGEIINFEEAFRYGLIASSKGSNQAREMIKDLHKKLTKKQIKKALCLAEKGPYPSWIQKQLCKW